jgi:hypothetical protein
LDVFTAKGIRESFTERRTFIIQTNRENLLNGSAHLGGQKMRIFIILLLLAMMMSGDVFTHAQNRRKELQVAKAVERFYSHFARREYDKMWNMLSDEVKQGNDNNKARYMSELSRTNSFRLTIDIKHVKITGDEATVTLIRRGRIDTDSRSFSELHEETWINQKGRWLFDSSRMLSDSPNPPIPSPAVHPQRTGY